MNKLVQHATLFCKRNAPTILTCLGGAGVVTTSVLAVKATPKALSVLEETKNEKGEELTKLEVAITVAPVYIPAILTGVATLACIFGANVLGKRQQAALMSAYALLDNSYKEYKNKVTELYGDDAHGQIVEGIAKDAYEENDISVEDDKQLFYDEFSGRYFESTMEAVQRAEYYVNRRLIMQEVAYLNDFYEHLDIPAMPGGELLGWSRGSNMYNAWQEWIDFSHTKVVMDDGLECYIVTMSIEPRLDFDDYA